MLKKTILVLGVIVTIGPISAPAARAIDYRLEIGLPTYQWEERFSIGTPRESGPMLTLGGYVSGFPWKTSPAVTLRGDFEMFLTRVQYNTFAQSLAAPTTATAVDTHSDYLGFRYEGSLGRRFGAGASGIEPFIGLGARWWLRDIGSTDTVAGYPERYYTFYGRLGVRANRPFRERFRLFGTASIDPLLLAWEQIDWTALSGDKFTVRNGTRVGWTLELGLGDGALEGTMYWRATRLGESNDVSCLGGAFRCFQPESDQDIIGIKVGFVL